MLVSWPPTNARFLSACPKPQVFVGNPSAPGIPLATIDQVLSSRASRSVQMALSDRDGITVSSLVTQMDDGFEAIVFALTARDLMSYQGYDRQAGADAEIVKLAEEAREDLLMMAPGAAGKRVTPQYVLVQAGTPQDSIRIRSHRRADAWARSCTDPRRWE